MKFKDYLLVVGAIIPAIYIWNILFVPPPLLIEDTDECWEILPKDQNSDVSIRPFRIEFADVVINDLRARLMHRRPFVAPLHDAGFTYGFNSNFVTEVLDFWQNKYNFQEREQFLNQYEHFKTNIQGLELHYIHVKPKVTMDVQVVPLLLLHSWPGSVREFYEIIPKLTTPRRDRKFVFELIIPSLPGFGFSQAPSCSGFGPAEIAVHLNRLMKRIGHDQYYVHGGHVGNNIGAYIATIFQKEVLGFHTNFPVLPFHWPAFVLTHIASWWPSLIVEPELQSRMYPLSDQYAKYMEETGFLHIQATKPDTIGLALTDSPVGLAAYILEKFSSWTNPDYKLAADGNLRAKYSLTQLLDNVMIYWVTNSITTSMRLHAEVFSMRNRALKMDEVVTDVPTWGIKFKHELMFCPDWLLKFKYKNYLHSTIVDDGGHFPALELPDILVDDMFDAVETFREFNFVKLQKEKKGLDVDPKTEVKVNPKTEVNVDPKTEVKVDPKTAQTVYDFKVKTIYGNEVSLEKYKGHVLVIVNVASQCGLTDNNYKQLNELYDRYAASKGLRVLAFPCNQFNGQEPGTPKDIINFTKDRGVKFEIFDKIDVNGKNAHPLWEFLKRTQGGTLGDFIKWNFSKFIIDRNGVPVERFGPNTDPLDMVPYLEKYW